MSYHKTDKALNFWISTSRMHEERLQIVCYFLEKYSQATTDEIATMIGLSRVRTTDYIKKGKMQWNYRNRKRQLANQ